MPKQVAHQENLHLQPALARYLEDFNETAYNSVSQAHHVDVEATVDKLAGNPLAAYRAFWRFENFIKPWLMKYGPAEQLAR